MKIFLLFLLTFSSIVSTSSNKKEEADNTISSIVSSGLDFIPVIGNIKCIGEAFAGKDIITGEKLSGEERALSLAGAIPLGNFLKSGKHFKNGQKFMKAAQRAGKAGKVKNAVNFGKASARAMKKADKLQKFFKGGVKATKNLFKHIWSKNDENENDDE